MRRTLALLTATALLTLGGATFATADEDEETETNLFVLNLIGKEDPRAQTHASGHRIFVPLEGECRIDLSEGSFGVTDDNCTDGTRAGFQLPNPDPEQDGVSSYRVYVRALAKPGGSAVLNTCKEEGSDTWCSTETVVVARAGGHSPQFDVTKETLTVCYDADNDGDLDRETIFSDENAGYFWKYENQGLRLAQLRFYPNTPTDISAPCTAA